MVSTKIIFRTDKVNSQGEHPLFLRLIKNRKSKYISLGLYLKSDHWDDENKRVKKSHPNAMRLNNYIAKKISEAQDVVIKLETEDKYASPNIIKDTIMGRSTISFIAYFERYLKEVEVTGSYITFSRSRTVLNVIKKYLNGKDLLLEELTVYWLKNLDNYLRIEKGNANNTVFTVHKIIRKIIYDAVREDLLPYERNPFLKFKLRWENNQKDYLTEDELMNFENVTLEPGTELYKYRQLYSFASQTGLRVSDLVQLKWKNFDGERIVILTKKTSALISLKLSAKLLLIIYSFKSDVATSEDNIFKLFDMDLDKENKETRFKSVQKATQDYNRALKKIAKLAGTDKKVTSHSARRNFGVHLLRKGANIVHVSRLLTHKSVKTTEQFYLSVANADLDTCMDLFN